MADLHDGITGSFKRLHDRIGLRDPNSNKYIGRPELWETAEKNLLAVVKNLGMKYSAEPIPLASSAKTKTGRLCLTNMILGHKPDQGLVNPVQPLRILQ